LISKKKINNAIYPELNPQHKGNIAARTSVPTIKSTSFNKKKRVAEITLTANKTPLKEAYLLVEIAKTKGSDKREKRGKLVITYEKLPVKINHEKMTVTGNIPKDNNAYLFVLIDENNFLVKSDRYQF